MGLEDELHNVAIEIHGDGPKELEAGLRPLDHYKQVNPSLVYGIALLTNNCTDAMVAATGIQISIAAVNSPSCTVGNAVSGKLAGMFSLILRPIGLNRRLLLTGYLVIPALTRSGLFFCPHRKLGVSLSHSRAKSQLTMNLRTHTFFLIALPVIYWVGEPTIGYRSQALPIHSPSC
jgi:hypothetical protein